MRTRIWTAAVTSSVVLAVARVLGATRPGEGAMTFLLAPGLQAAALIDGSAAQINESFSFPALAAMYGVNLVLYGGLLYLLLWAWPALKRRGHLSKKAEKAWA